MNGNGLNTIGLNLDVVLGLFWTTAMALVGLSMDSMMDLDLNCIYGFGPIPWTSYGLNRTLLAQGYLR